MIYKKDIAKIIARKWLLAATDSEKSLLHTWRKRSEKNENGYILMNRWWQLSGSSPEKKDLNEPLPIDEFFLHTRARRIGQRTSRVWKVAASLAVLVALTSLLFNFMFRGGTSRVELMANAGQQTEAVLPDGSHVWLNNGSKLIYEHRFGRIRALELQGEALFTVSPDRTSPFIVDASGLKIRATGTHFNVRNYSDDPTIETTLLEGGVKIKTPSGNFTHMLPGQTVSFDKNKDKLVLLNIKPDDNIAWKEGKLVFNNSSFANLVTRIERWYDVEIVYDAKIFENIHYSGTIRNLRLEQVFGFINLTIPIEVKLNNDNFTITLNKVQTKKTSSLCNK